MRASAALPTPVDVAAWRSRAVEWAVARRWWIVAALVVVQWAILAHEALRSIHHDGWFYANGDDGSWYWTSAWLLAKLQLPYTAVGAGWPLLLAPFAAVFGPVMTDGLPAVVLLNVLVLTPAAVVGMYLLADRLAGRRFALWATAAWVVLPSVGLALHVARHRDVVVDFFLPTGRGLNALSDFPSMVCAIFAAWATLRAFDSRRVSDGALAGLLLGYLGLIKPANGPLVVAAAGLLLVGGRWRALGATCATAIPAALALLLWKKRGTGGVPAFSGGGGGGGGGGGAPAVVENAHRYVNVNLHQLAVNAHELREVFWSLRVLEALLVIGVAGLLFKARLRGAFVAAWFLLFGLIKGTAPVAHVYDTSLYRFLLPAWPAWILIVAAAVYCWPTGRSRRVVEAPPVPRPVPARLLAVLGLLLAVLPLAALAAASPARRGTIVNQNSIGAPIPVVDFGLAATRIGPSDVRLTWRPRHTRTTTTYLVYKAAGDGCEYAAQTLCRFRMTYIGQTRGTSFVDGEAVSTRMYRIALAVGAQAQRDTPTLLVVSRPLEVRAP